MRAALYWRSASVSSSRIRCIIASMSSVAPVVGAGCSVAAISVLLEEVGVLLANPRDLPQHHLQVVTERGFGAVRIVLGQPGDDLPVLADHLCQVARHRQA